MISRVTISQAIGDARADSKKKLFNDLKLDGKVTAVSILDSYTIDGPVKTSQLPKVAAAFANPHLEKAAIGKIVPAKKFNWLVEIGFLPGVTDNVGTTAKETIEDLLKVKFKDGRAVYSSRIFLLTGTLTKADADQIAATLYNPLIERARIIGYSEFTKAKDLAILVPKVKLPAQAGVIRVDLNVGDEELTRIGKQGVMDPDGTPRGPLALDLAYMKAIRDYFKTLKRLPTDIEIESIAQTWSEHCKHTIFADPIDDIKDGLYKTYIKGATNLIRKRRGQKDICVSVFTDNAGAIIFDDEYLVTHKVETHNSPSALDPFGGAITGIVGVNRDAIGFGLGAKPIANMYGFCLADPKDARPLYRDKAKTQRMLTPKRIMEGVIQGVNVGGNCSGIPTPHGFVYFHDRFRGKPLVFVGTVGLIPRQIGKKPSTVKAARPGDYIVVVGGRVGQDGIHGATFSSEGMSSGSPATAVQIGDPITQKKLSDALIKEARDLGLYNSITDNGAGGISCSVAEMARECNGCKVELEKVPLKYPGLAPWKIWISESQERMTLAIPPAKWPAFKKLMAKRGVEATIIGTFTKSGKCVVSYHSKTIVDIDLEFLHNGLPVKQLTTTEVKRVYAEPPAREVKDFTKDLEALLKRLNVTSYAFISKQYDHEVQANSILKPLQGRGEVNADVAVIKPVPSSKKGVVLSSALYPTYTEIDGYQMAAACIDGAIRSAVAAGCPLETLAILDNFCWCSSNDPERLDQLKKTVKACYDYAVAYNVPFISGKDSMFNDFRGFDEAGNPVSISSLPTLLISAIGVMPDATKAISLDFKFAGDLIYLLGDTASEMGGSEYFAYLSNKDKKDYLGNHLPTVDAAANKKLYEAFAGAANQELVASSIGIGRGGLAVALAKSAIGGKLGAAIKLPKKANHSGGDEADLFSESAGRILVSINPKNKKSFEKIMKGLPITCLGTVTKNQALTVAGHNGKPIINLPVAKALAAYKSTFKNY